MKQELGTNFEFKAILKRNGNIIEERSETKENEFIVLIDNLIYELENLRKLIGDKRGEKI